MKDQFLTNLITPSILQSFAYDSIQTQCQIVERNFQPTTKCPHEAVNFLTRWLNLVVYEESGWIHSSKNSTLWQFANICTILEYELNDLLSFYSACRIIDHLQSSASSYDDLAMRDSSRSEIREKIFVLMFQSLWENLVDATKNPNKNNDLWIENYTVITRYYPSEKVLGVIKLIEMKDRIEFMNLAYMILLNEQTAQPINLVQQLLNALKLSQQSHFGDRKICLHELPMIIDKISNYCQAYDIKESTLMIDIQQWAIHMLKSSRHVVKDEMKTLFQFLNQPNSSLSLPMKQLLFDELCNLEMENRRVSRSGHCFWDRICLLPTIVHCIDNINMEYQLPYHPSVITDPKQNQILLDLYFFYLRRLSSEQSVQTSLLKKIIISSSPSGVTREHHALAYRFFTQIKDYFIIQLTAVLLCREDPDRDDKSLNDIFSSVIDQHLKVDFQATQLTPYVKSFLSVIITQKKWEFLKTLLQSKQVKKLNDEWAKSMINLLAISKVIETSKTLRVYHQVQFTIHTNDHLSIFPKLHKPYHSLNQCVHQCSRSNDPNQRWNLLIEWIQTALNLRPPFPTALEIKVMLLLNIYYNYYCTNRLKSLDGLLSVIKEHLQPNHEEWIVFSAFIEPDKCMFGYKITPGDPDENHLNNLFHLDFDDQEYLAVRHVLVNLLAMILLAGKNSFLWTFAFEPSKLTDTYGKIKLLLAIGMRDTALHFRFWLLTS